MIKFIYNDGGRKDAGFKGEAKDCVVRALAIAGGYDYGQLYQIAANLNDRIGTQKSARNGLPKNVTRELMNMLGWKWTPTMLVGQGCTTHLNPAEVPMNCIVKVSKHVAAVVNGDLHDTHDCSRSGTRCVYGYWTKA